MHSDRVLGGKTVRNVQLFSLANSKRGENQISRAVHSFGFLRGKKRKWNKFTLQ